LTAAQKIDFAIDQNGIGKGGFYLDFLAMDRGKVNNIRFFVQNKDAIF
jgi:hypothetical protein